MTMVLLCYFAIKNNIYIYHLLFTPYKSIKRNNFTWQGSKYISILFKENSIERH